MPLPQAPPALELALLLPPARQRQVMASFDPPQGGSEPVAASSSAGAELRMGQAVQEGRSRGFFCLSRPGQGTG